MSDELDKMDLDLNLDDEFSLESILAEYKGSAYIASDKKTPSQILEAQANQIIKEATSPIPVVQEEASEPVRADNALSDADKPEIKAAPETYLVDDKSDEVYSPLTLERDVAAEVQKSFAEGNFDSDDEDEDFEEEREPGRFRLAMNSFFSRFNAARKSDSVEDDDDDEVEDDIPSPDIESTEELGLSDSDGRHEDSEIDDEWIPSDTVSDNEPDIIQETKRFMHPLKKLSLKAGVVLFLGLLMLLFTILFENGRNVIFGIGRNQLLLTGLFMIFELISIMLSLDIIIEGLTDLIHGEPGLSSMLFMSCLCTFISGAAMLITRNTAHGLPFCLISVFSLYFALRGKYLYYQGMSDSLRVVATSKNIYGVVVESEDIHDRNILKKRPQSYTGFYNNLTQKDFTEYVTELSTPAFLLLAAVLTVLFSAVKGGINSILFILAAMVSVATSFSAFISYSMPLKIVARKTRFSGCAVAGWGGACYIHDSDGVLISDSDIFPVGSVSVTGIKLFEGASQNKVIGYTGSLLAPMNSGIGRAFSELLKSQGIIQQHIDDLNYFDGGVSGLCRGERVLVGSSAFLASNGILVPGNINEKNAVFASINGELSGIFSLNYIPANSVQSALISMIQTKISMILSVRDFNVTPTMIQQRFKVSLEDVEYIPSDVSSKIMDSSDNSADDSIAVLCREGLGPFARIISNGRQLRQCSIFMTLISVFSSVIGLFLMFGLCWGGSFASASSWNAFKFLIIIHFIVLAISFIARKRD